MMICWKRLWNNPVVLTLHISFIVILAGALCTYMFRQKGTLRLTPGVCVSEFHSVHGKALPLPAVMQLDSFRVEYYPGKSVPRDYNSYLKVNGKPGVISMNKILKVDGYRFCQAGYDYDGSSILTVSRDPLGIALVYSGYMIFAVSGLWILFSPGGRWRRLLKSRSMLSVAVGHSEYWSYGRISDICLWILTAVSIMSFVALWILSGHVPLADTGGTLLFAALLIELLLLFFRRHGHVMQLTGMILAGAMTLTAFLTVNPFAGPLQPVLNSPWLATHVSLAMASYALFGLTFAAAVAALVRPSSGPRMRVLSLAMLYPAVWLLGLGIITGSVWANVSWGNYWSWDPKETLALVTFLVYALPLHPGVGFLKSPRHFHIYMLIAILTVAATYFGVNLFNSLHAYN